MIEARVAAPGEREEDIASLTQPLGKPTSKPEDESATMQMPKSQHKKSVSFADLDIRSYSVTIGDHPCCTSGCPLTLDWDYQESDHMSIDQYEATRTPRRQMSDLRTTSEHRLQILEEDGLSGVELRRAQRKLHRARTCSARLCERMNEKFFHEKGAPQVSPSPSA